MSDKQKSPPIRIQSGAPWEAQLGYCRAMRVGSHIFVSGTAPIGDDGKTVAPGDAYRQAHRCFELAEKALRELDCPLSAVVRTRMFVTEMSRWPEYGKAHREFFGENPPTTTMVEVKSLIRDDMMIEIEIDALGSPAKG